MVTKIKQSEYLQEYLLKCLDEVCTTKTSQGEQLKGMEYIKRQEKLGWVLSPIVINWRWMI